MFPSFSHSYILSKLLSQFADFNFMEMLTSRHETQAYTSCVLNRYLKYPQGFEACKHYGN